MTLTISRYLMFGLFPSCKQVRFPKQLQNAGPLLTMDQTSQLIWLGSGKNYERQVLILYMSVKCWVHIFSGSFGSSGSALHVRRRNNLYCVKCCVHIPVFSGSFGSSGSAGDQRTRYKLFWLSVGFIYLVARLALLARQCM